MRFILLVRGTAGDFLPFFQIGKALKKRGHWVTLMTHEQYGKAVQEAELEFASIGLENDFVELLGQTTSYSTRDFIAGLKQGLPSLLNGYERYRHLFEQEKTWLVAHHNTHLGAQFISEKHGMPVVSVFTAPHFVLNMPFWEEAYSIASNELNDIRSAMGLPHVQNWRAWWRMVPYSIGLWPAWYAPSQKDWPIRVKPVGFILNEPSTQPLPVEVMEIVEKPTILITHATSTTTQPQFFDLSIRACIQLGWQVIVVTPHNDLLPATLPPGVHYFPALPFVSLLPHMQAVIHHGGIGTLVQTLAAEIPQLILGVGYDRPDNGARAQGLGIAEYVPITHWQVETIRNALQKLTTSSFVQQQCKMYAARVRSDHSLETARQFLENITALPIPESSAVAPIPENHPASLMANSPKLHHLSAEQKAFLALKLRQKRTAV